MRGTSVKPQPTRALLRGAAVMLVTAVLGWPGNTRAAETVEAPARGISPVTARAIEGGSHEQWRYLLYLPERYFQQPTEALPVLLFLHGSSARGKDLEMLKRYGPPSRLKNEPNFPMAMVAPQLPGGGWDPASVLALLDEVLSIYRFDADRVYLSGVSLGGQGSWDVAAKAPGRFAAFAPVCGYGDLSDAPRLTKLPIWAFHGALDDIVPLAPHQALVEAINRAGGAARLSIFENGDHGNIIVPVFAREGQNRIYDWFLKHRRGQEVSPLPVEQQIEHLPGPGAAKIPVVTPPATSTATEPSPQAQTRPQPGEVWDLLFRLLDGNGAKPHPEPQL